MFVYSTAVSGRVIENMHRFREYMYCGFCSIFGCLTEFLTLRFVTLVADIGVWMLLIFHVIVIVIVIYLHSVNPMEDTILRM
jgi:uncharacterized membrane protein